LQSLKTAKNHFLTAKNRKNVFFNTNQYKNRAIVLFLVKIDGTLTFDFLDI